MRFGIYAPDSPEQGILETQRLEQRLRRPVGIVNWYQHWGGWGPEFNPSWGGQRRALGAAPAPDLGTLGARPRQPA